MRVVLIMGLMILASVMQLPSTTHARIHHLVLDDDSREQVTISTFGFLKNGVLQLKVNKLSVDPSIKLDSVRKSFAFIIEKNTNRGFSSFSSNDRNQDYCSKMFRFKSKGVKENEKSSSSSSFNYNQMIPEAILNSKSIFTTKDRTYYLVVFQLDLNEKQINITRVGSDLRNVIIKPEFTYSQYGFNSNYKPYYQYPSTSNQTTREAPTTTVDDLNSLIEEKNILLKTIKLNVTDKSSISFKFELNIKSSDEEGLYTLSFYNCFQPDIYADYLTKATTTAQTSDKSGDLLAENGLAYVKNTDNIKYGVYLDLELMERNEDSFLSAGEMPVPTLYLTWSIIYFLAGISWTYILRSSKNGGDVFKIHYLMLGLVFIKAITLTFHAINMHYIAVNGRHEAIWAILYYITYVLRGLLLIISILLVGTGWTFIKHVLSENERRLFVIVIPLQIVAVIAYIFLEEKEEGDAVYVTWRQLFFLVDLLCCGAILFPVVWSIKHLESASQTDGKMVINLKKLRIFKHFYIMVICYIYFTRIIGFLMAQVIPFRYEWFDELSTEVVTFTFFALTAYKFQPASNNPYLQLSQSDNNNNNDDDMDEETQLQMEKLNSGDMNDEQELLNGNVDTVLDLIDQNYHSRSSGGGATTSTNNNINTSHSSVSPSSGDVSYRKTISSTKI